MEFAPGVLERLGYYVYELVDPDDGRVFYVGKGVGNRVHAHAAWASKSESEKSRAIMDIRAAGHEPIHRIVAHGLSEESAFLLEAVLIEHHGMASLVNRVRGHGHTALMLRVEDINSMYGAPTVSADAINLPTLFVSLNGGKSNKPYPSIRDDADLLMRRTVGDWRVDSSKARAVKQVAGCYNGIVRVVFPVDGWEEVEYPKGKRKRFKSQGPDPQSPILGARVAAASGDIITVFKYGSEKSYAGLPTVRPRTSSRRKSQD